MTYGSPSQCEFCTHWRPAVGSGRNIQTCAAYPGGIPDDVWTNRVDHRSSQPGDHGVTWAPDEGAAFPDWALLTGQTIPAGARSIAPALGPKGAVDVRAEERQRILQLAGIEVRDWKAQVRDPGGDDGGQWISGGAAVDAVREVLSPAEIDRDYGDEVGDASFGDEHSVVAREGRLLTIQTPDAAGKHVVYSAPDSAEAHTLADMVEAISAEDLDEDQHPNGLSNWDGGDGYLVGRDPAGDVIVRFTGDASVEDLDKDISGHDGFDLSVEEAGDFAAALRDMAYAADDWADAQDDDDDQDATVLVSSDDPDDDPTRSRMERHRALQLLGFELRKFNVAQKRHGKGTVGAGQWTSMSDRVMATLTAWVKTGGSTGGGDPLAAYTQPQLKTAATQLGLNPPKGMKVVPLKGLLITHAQRQPANTAATPALAIPAAQPHPPRRVSPNLLAGVQGVTTTQVPVPVTHHPTPLSNGALQTQNVHVGGVFVGTIHKYTDGLGWMPETARGIPLPSVGGRSRNDALNALLAYHQRQAILQANVNAATPPLVAPAAAKPKVSTRKLPTVMPGQVYSAGVYVNGSTIGAIHQDSTGTWMAVPPTALGGNGRITKHTTRKAAVDSVVAQHQPASPASNAAAPGAKGAAAPVFTGSPSGVAGVTTRPKWGHTASSPYLEVGYGGVSIGETYQDGRGRWVAFDANRQDVVGSHGSHLYSTEDDALTAIRDAHLAATGQTATPAKPSFVTAPITAMFGSAKASYVVAAGKVDLGTIHHDVNGDWFAFPPSAANWNFQQPPGGFKTKNDAMMALHNAQQQSVGAPAQPVQKLTNLGVTPDVHAALNVVYGVDPKAGTAVRQLAVYGALRKDSFDGMDSNERGIVLGDLSYVATTSKGANADRAKKLIDRFTPAGTPNGTIPPQAIIPPAGAASNQTRVADPTGTPGLLKMRAKGARGRSGDGWTKGAGGRGGPWGHYGAAGLMLRNVDDKGVERFLMVERGPGISDPGKWQFPGGAKEELETFHEGAAREVVEELGFKETDLDVARVHGTHTTEVPHVMVAGLQGGQVPWSYVSIAATVPKQLIPDLSTHHARMETSDAKWMTRTEIDGLDVKGKLLKPLAGGQLQQNVLTLFPLVGAGTGRPPARTTRPARLAGTPTFRAPHKPSTGTNLLKDTTAINKLRQDVKTVRTQFAGKTADDRMAAIGRMQGFDAVPTVASRTDMDRLLATGNYIEAWRGVRGAGATRLSGGNRGGGAISQTKTAAQINEDMRSGTAYYGKGVYGNGYYFATERRIAETYSDHTPGSVVRVLIPKSAVIAKHSKVVGEARSIASRNSKAKGKSHENGTLYDEGRYAAAKGIDALEIDHGSASHVARPGKPAYNVVNRSVLIVEEA